MPRPGQGSALAGRGRKLGAGGGGGGWRAQRRRNKRRCVIGTGTPLLLEALRHVRRPFNDVDAWGPGDDHDVRRPFHGLRVGELRALESGSDIGWIEKG